jgi:hypothetical protein
MRPLLVALLIFATPAAALAAESALPSSVTGDWVGQIDTGQKVITVVFHLGAVTTADSPTENLFAVPAQASFADGKLKVEIAAAGGVYQGTLGADGKFSGLYVQNQLPMDLVLERKAAPAKP